MSLDQLYLLPILTGGIFFATGFIMYFFPPKKINALYGYRTQKSMQNQEQWDFSQTYSAKLLIKLGALLALSSLLGFVLNLTESAELIISFILLMSVVVLVLILTEKAISKQFKS